MKYISISLRIFNVYCQSGSSEMIICQPAYVCMSFNLEHSSTTLELPSLSLKSEENGRLWLR